VRAVDLESVYKSVCDEMEPEKSCRRVAELQNTQRLSPYDDLFYAKVLIGGEVEVRAMIDSGSMACTLSSRVLPELLHARVFKCP
jgi:hypothetical protein